MCQGQYLTEQIERLAAEASHGCGLVYELFVEKFSTAVDYAFAGDTPDRRKKAIAIAKDHGYETAEKIEAKKEEMADRGYCSHGLTWLTCPCGCFEHD